MEWYAYYYDSNARRVEHFNIFKHSGFKLACREAFKRYKDHKELFLADVRGWLMYYFWSKCEWEIVISHFPEWPEYPDKKIDVYDQVMMNWDIFADYIWENREKLRRRR